MFVSYLLQVANTTGFIGFLLARYRETIPVVVIDDRKTLAAPIRTADLRAALADTSPLPEVI